MKQKSWKEAERRKKNESKKETSRKLEKSREGLGPDREGIEGCVTIEKE